MPFCPICGAELAVVEKNGVRRLRCPVHGLMKWMLERDPKVSAAVAEACDAVGVKNVEAQAQ